MFWDKLRPIVKVELAAFPEPLSDTESDDELNSDEEENHHEVNLAKFERIVMDKRNARKTLKSWKMKICHRAVKRWWLDESAGVKSAVRK